MTVSATGTRSMSWSAAARSAARTWVDRDLARLVELDPEAGAVDAGELEPADVGVAAVLLRPDVRDVAGPTTVDRQVPTRPPRLRSGYVSCGPEPNQRRSSGPGTTSSTVPTRGEVGQLVGQGRRLGHGDAPVDEAGVDGLVLDDDPGRGDELGCGRPCSGPPGRRRRVAARAGRPRAPPSARPCRRSGRCRSGRATATASAAAASSGWMRRPSASSATVPAGSGVGTVAPAAAAVADRELQGADLEAGRCPGQRRTRSRCGRSGTPRRHRPAARPSRAASRSPARPVRAAGRSNALPATSSPPTVSE